MTRESLAGPAVRLSPSTTAGTVNGSSHPNSRQSAVPRRTVHRENQALSQNRWRHPSVGRARRPALVAWPRPAAAAQLGRAARACRRFRLQRPVGRRAPKISTRQRRKRATVLRPTAAAAVTSGPGPRPFTQQTTTSGSARPSRTRRRTGERQGAVVDV